jgi:hypothetical protein
LWELLLRVQLVGEVDTTDPEVVEWSGSESKERRARAGHKKEVSASIYSWLTVRNTRLVTTSRMVPPHGVASLKWQTTKCTDLQLAWICTRWVSM